MKGASAALFLAAAIGPLACGGGPSSPSGVKVGEPFSVKNGASAVRVGASLQVRFQELLADSRCPVDVNCIRGGDAAIRVAVRTANDAPETTYELHTGPDGKPTLVDLGPTQRLELVELKPAPRSTLQVPAADYAATLKVTAY